MERSNAESKMRCMPLVLFGASFLRPVLRTYKLDIAEGIVLVVDNENKAKEFLSLITNQIDSFQKIDSWNSRSKKIDNYCCGLMLINRTSKEEEVEKLGITVPEAIQKEHFDTAVRKISMANSITSIKKIQRINFLEIFEKINGVEEILNKSKYLYEIYWGKMGGSSDGSCV